jgi:hypothetical protein
MTIKLPKRYPLLIHIARKYHYRIWRSDCHFRLSRRARVLLLCLRLRFGAQREIVGWRYTPPSLVDGLRAQEQA